MKKRWIAALALTGLLLTTGAYAESTPEAAAAPVQAETTAEPQHNLTVTTKYRFHQPVPLHPRAQSLVFR